MWISNVFYFYFLDILIPHVRLPYIRIHTFICFASIVFIVVLYFFLSVQFFFVQQMINIINFPFDVFFLVYYHICTVGDKHANDHIIKWDVYSFYNIIASIPTQLLTLCAKQSRFKRILYVLCQAANIRRPISIRIWSINLCSFVSILFLSLWASFCLKVRCLANDVLYNVFITQTLSFTNDKIIFVLSLLWCCCCCYCHRCGCNIELTHGSKKKHDAKKWSGVCA